MVRTVDHEPRRQAVLAAAINKYIAEAAPVSSQELARQFNLSPATIRNIFAELEEAGLLTHPYTSGGRIPTRKGYRYYVDFLISESNLVMEEKERISREYQRRINPLEDILDRTSEIISEVTHYAGIAVSPQWQDRLFYKGIGFILDQPEFHDYRRIGYLVKLIEDKQHLLKVINREFNDKVKVYIGDELECPEIEGCSLVVSQYRLKDKTSGKIAVLGPMRMEYRHAIPALEYISGVLTDIMDNI